MTTSERLGLALDLMALVAQALFVVCIVCATLSQRLDVVTLGSQGHTTYALAFNAQRMPLK